MKAPTLVIVCCVLSVLLCCLLVGIGGCRVISEQSQKNGATVASTPPQSGASFSMTEVDQGGRTLTLKAKPKRIVSLTPGSTEVLFAIGAGGEMVEGTEADDFPEEAKKLPHVSGMSENDLEKILVQKPDLVVASASLNAKLIATLDRANVPILVLEPKTLDDVYTSINLLGHATGHDSEAGKVVEDMKAKFAEVRKSVSASNVHPKVLILYDVSPAYTSPTESFIHDLIGVAGGEDVVQKSLPGNIISPEKAILSKPDVIICGKYLEDKIKSTPGWSVIPAVKNGRFFHASAESVLVRPTPRLVQGVEELAKYLQQH